MTVLRRLRADKYASDRRSIAIVGMYVLLAIFVGLFIAFFVQLRNTVDDDESFQKESAQIRTRLTAGAITSELNDFETSVREFADELESSPDLMNIIRGKLDAFVLANRNVLRAGVLFTPADGDRFAPFAHRRPDPLDQFILERGSEEFDYTDRSQSRVNGIENAERYLGPFVDGEAWVRPFYDEEFDSVILEFGVRLSGLPDPETGETGGGVLYAETKIDSIIGNLNWDAFRESGYGLIVSGDDRYLAHPQNERVLEIVDESLTELFTDEASGIIEYNDELDRGDAWLVFESIGPVDWTLGHVVLTDLVIARTAESQRVIMRVTAAAIAALVIAVIILSRAYMGGSQGLWITSISMSIMFIAGLGFFWFLEMDTPDRRPPNELNVEIISAFEDAVFNKFGFLANRAQVGATIESVTFIAVDQAIVTGRIWQKLDNLPIDTEEGTGGDLIRDDTALPVLRTGFLFPQDVKFQTMYRRVQASNGQFGWTYETVMTVDFDFKKYPFDRAIISVPLEQSDFGRAVISLPDLDGYDELFPGDRPGLRSDLSIVGWTPEEAFFDYEALDFENDLGLLRPIGTRIQPALSYNLRMSRVIAGPLITNILPLGIVVALLFTVMMTSAKMNLWILSVAGNVRRSGQSIVRTANGLQGGGPSYALIAVAGVLSYSATLLFVVISGHARLRSQFPEAGLLYLEFFYFVAYLAIFAVAVNSLAFAGHRIGVVQYRDNLLPKVAFWPFLTGYLFIATFVTFH